MDGIKTFESKDLGIAIYDVNFALLEDGKTPDEHNEPEEEIVIEESDGTKLSKKVKTSGDVISGLATYKHIMSKSNPRTEKLVGITFHHMSGRMTGKQCADYFCDTSRQVSANYCIGPSGDIACNVPENRRAWTSSSRDNDQKRITMELSNDSGAPDWHISDKTIQAAINLAVDICKRYGIRKLYYDGTKSAPVTWHCQFADTDCPGPYFKKITHYVCGQINSRLGSEQLGDLDGDGKVTAKDARLALRIAAGLAKPTLYQLRVGDLNGNGKFDSTDARMILRKAAKLK